MSEQNETNTPEEPQTYSFKAETKQLLNILIHSLYKSRETFLRELISNASDALNRLRYEMLVERNVLNPDAELCIRITVDDEKKMIVIEDTGIGMTQDELIENLGTIAQSGAKAFLEAIKDDTHNITEVIGQFGVGFYSVFMVAEWVRVVSRSARPESEAAFWYATGEDNFNVGKAEKDERGSRIEIKLKEDASEFASEFKIKEIIKKHSDYVGFPIYLGDGEEQVNQQTAIWRKSAKEITEEQYKEFYRQITLEFDEPLMHIHLSADAPIQVYSILYVPGKVERGMLSLRKEDGLKLYSRNILIDDYSKDLLPEYFRFMQGVVDTEDLPLNVSRETVQATGMMTRLKKILTGRVIKELEDLAKNDQEKYEDFWGEFGSFIKQGVAVDRLDGEKLYSLLRFKTSSSPETWSSLDQVVDRVQDEKKEIFYIIGDDPQSVLRSPHLEAFDAQGIEVLLLTDPIDSFMLMGFQKYKDYELKNVAQANLEIPKSEGKEGEEKTISDEVFDDLIKIFQEQLGDKVSEVRSTKKLSRSVARLVDPEDSINPEMQRVYKYLDKEFEVPKKILELNPNHPILLSLTTLDKDSELSKLIVDQIYENALLVEGLHPDPSSMVQRIQELIEAALS